MSLAGHSVTIKGTKEGLVFLIEETASFSEVLKELNEKLSQAFDKFVDDAVTSVIIKIGNRKLSEEEKNLILSVFKTKPNLIVKAIHTEEEVSSDRLQKLLETDLQIHRGTVRSGQVLQHDGNLLLLGDINPGGSVIVTGDLYVMGALRGMAHSGANGKEEAIIVASQMFPSQLRIASVISRSPDEWVKEDSYMEFAYLEDGTMRIDKVTNLSKRHKTLT